MWGSLLKWKQAATHSHSRQHAARCPHLPSPPMSADGEVSFDDLLVPEDPTGTFRRVKDRIRVDPYASVDPSTPKPPGHIRVVCISGTDRSVGDVPAVLGARGSSSHVSFSMQTRTVTTPRCPTATSSCTRAILQMLVSRNRCPALWNGSPPCPTPTRCVCVCDPRAQRCYHSTPCVACACVLTTPSS